MSRACCASTFACLLAILPASGFSNDLVDYVRDVQPILQQHCLKCHGADEQNGGISFHDTSSLLAEADSGKPAIVVGAPDESELIHRIRSTHEDDRMPPEGDRLDDKEIDLLMRWIAEGTDWSDADHAAKPVVIKSEHWSFQPLSNPMPPPVEERLWPRNAIDRFVQSRRESAGLQVTIDADPAALIRRTTYGLTGLPPTPDEVNEFVAAARSPLGLEVAMEELVDRLLSRSSYGERWGRHWMDWVRYADTAGDNSDYPIPQAYLYRNYIIDAFNEDVPYDRFLTEQIAGDLLPADNQEQRNRQRIATGYLAMARRFGSLVERYPWHLTIEDTIDNMGRTMLGLTLACARCHDHKFDPITTRDYYGLYGIFASTRYPFPGLELFQTQNDFVSLLSDSETAEVIKPYQETTDRLTSELKRLLADCERQSLKNASDSNTASIDEQRALREKLDALLLKARKAGEKLAEHLKTIPELPTAYAVQDRDPINARIQIKGEPDRLGAEVPRKFPDVLGAHRLPERLAESTSGRLELAAWIASPANPLTARVIVNRIWQRHFGIGLVPSPSDLGLRGELPSHPELLDWLASEFIRSGWSMKHLHRLILNSHTYRLSSLDVEASLAIDPGNRMYWKFNRQRLDAESIRDTLLLVAGSLDSTISAEPHPFPARENWKYTQHHPFKDDYASSKRSVYLMTKRLTAQPYFQTFDGPDPNACTSDRDQSVTALQALYFVNDEFLHEQSYRLAAKLLRHTQDDQLRLNQAFQSMLCRLPTEEESILLRKHLIDVGKVSQQDLALDASKVELQTWSSLVRSLMRLNEFLYLD